MEFFIELIGEVLGAVFEGLIESRRIPKPARIFIVSLLFVPLITLGGVLIYTAHGLALRLVFTVITLLFIAGFAILIRKTIKK